MNVPVVVLERAPKPREEGGAIALWPNAFRALDALGLAGSMREKHPLLDRSHLNEFAVSFQSKVSASVLCLTWLIGPIEPGEYLLSCI